MSEDNKSILETLAGLSDVDKDTLRQIKIKQVSNLHTLYLNKRDQILPLIERIGLFGVMIDRNHQRLCTKNDTKIEEYSLDKRIELYQALENPKELIFKIDKYKTILGRLEKEDKRLNEIRDVLADKVDKRVILDGLTNLYRKEFFKRRVIEETARAMRTGEGFLIFMSDIDHFGEYNDTFGHVPAGDDVLKKVAEVLSGSVREEDIGERQGNYENEGGRQGGEEFIFCMHGVPKEKAYSAVDRIRGNVESTVLPKYTPLKPEENGYGIITSPDGIQPGYDSTKVTISLGFLVFDPDEFKDLSAFKYSPNLKKLSESKKIRPKDICEEVMRRIDVSLYEAKRAGRNNVKEYDPGMENGKNGQA